MTGADARDAYRPPSGIYDEAFKAADRPRDHYRELLAALADAGLEDLAGALRAEVRRAAVTFSASPDGYLALDPVPRLLTAAEWETISAGIVQRARALDRFAADVYGDQEVISAGVVPRRLVESSAHYEPAMLGAPPPPAWVSVVGFDLVRAPDGAFRVLEDQVRMPSGIAYTLAARSALDAVLPHHPSRRELGAPAEALGEALRAAAPEGVADPRVALLSPGPDTAGWYEHERIGRELGIEVLGCEDLERRGEELHARIGRRSIRLDVVYQRTDEDRFTRADGSPTVLGELLLEPCRAGRLTCVNAPGSGVGDDKAVHAYVEEMVRFYLADEPVLKSVPTLDLAEPRPREEALADRDRFVFKPRGEMGGEGVVVWSAASAEERGGVDRALRRSPAGLIAQRRVELSSHPTVRDAALAPRRVDLRPYVIRTAEREWVLPGGLTRVALERGSLIVNSGRGGGVKDTWVLR